MPSQLNYNPIRALGSNGNPSPGAKAYFYETGTTTPITVYTDSGLGTPHPTPLVADAQGVFAQVFTDGATAVKVDLTTSGGATLTGYPIDPVQLISSTGSAATAVSFAPITGNAATEVQGAIQNLTTLWLAVTTWARTFLTSADVSAARTALGLGTAAIVDVIDEDSFATDSATRPPSQQSTKAYITASIPPVWDYESAEVTAGTTQQTFTHGLGATPSEFAIFMRCTATDLNYAVNDVVKMSSYEGNGARGFAVWANNTLVGATGSNSFYLADKTSGTVAVATPASWKIFAKARL